MDELMSLRGGIFLLITAVVLAKTLRQPHIGLIFYIALSLLEDNILRDEFDAAYNVLRLPMITALITGFAWALNRNQYREILAPVQLWILVCMLAIMGASCLSAGGDIATNFQINRFLRIVILFFLTINLINTEEKLKHLLWVLVILYAALSVDAYYNYKVLGYEVARPSGMSWGGIGGNFGGRIAATAMIAYTLFWLEKSLYRRAFLTFAVFIMSGTTFVTYSRASAIALGMGYMALMFFDIKNKQKRFATIGMVIALAFYVLFRAQGLQDNLETVGDYEQDGSAMARVYQMEAALNIIQSNMMLGVGPGNFSGVYIDFVDNVPGDGPQPEETKSMHSTPFQIGAELGVFALGIFVILLFITFADFLKIRAIPRNNDDKKTIKELGTAVSISFGVYFIQSMFIPGAYNDFLYLMFALVFIARLIATKPAEALKQAKPEINKNGKKFRLQSV
ncbi:MAG: O-antigen ligase family protein [Deltaproteobacteria bacterium]